MEPSERKGSPHDAAASSTKNQKAMPSSGNTHSLPECSNILAQQAQSEMPSRTDDTRTENAMLGKTKIFADPVHGHIELHPLCVKIVDTPEFQRLRFIKQMGGTYFVYPGAAHNRFEHSLGVCHLAGKFARALQKQQHLEITDEDVLCVEIAGLCHDLGHGPCSHLFDSLVIPEIIENQLKHEELSIKMFDYMMDQNGLEKIFSEMGLKKKDICFIKELINGPLDKKVDQTKTDEWTYKGREKNKQFLYQIVSNKESGIDVDKWDYFARDSLMLGMKSNFNHLRAIAFARVIDQIKLPDGSVKPMNKQICYRDKELMNFYDMFNIRYLLHHRACKHRVTVVIELMIADALIRAFRSQSEEVKFRGKDGTPLDLKTTLSDMDMTAFSQITDDIVMRIYHSKDQNLKEAKDLIGRIFRRQLYVFIGEKQFTKQPYNSKEKVFKDIVSTVIGFSDETLKEMEWTRDNSEKILKEDLAVHLVKLDYGKGEENPIDNVFFFTKKEPDVAFHFQKDKVSFLLPQQFSEQRVFVFCRSENEKNIKNIQTVFDKWSEIDPATQA